MKEKPSVTGPRIDKITREYIRSRRGILLDEVIEGTRFVIHHAEYGDKVYSDVASIVPFENQDCEVEMDENEFYDNCFSLIENARDGLRILITRGGDKVAVLRTPIEHNLPQAKLRSSTHH